MFGRPVIDRGQGDAAIGIVSAPQVNPPVALLPEPELVSLDGASRVANGTPRERRRSNNSKRLPREARAENAPAYRGQNDQELAPDRPVALTICPHAAFAMLPEKPAGCIWHNDRQLNRFWQVCRFLIFSVENKYPGNGNRRVVPDYNPANLRQAAGSAGRQMVYCVAGLVHMRVIRLNPLPGRPCPQSRCFFFGSFASWSSRAADQAVPQPFSRFCPVLAVLGPATAP